MSSQPKVFRIDMGSLPDFTRSTPKERCWETLLNNGEQVMWYVQRAAERPEPCAVMVIAACDVHGAGILNMLMPGHNLVEEARATGGDAFGYGIVKRAVVEEVLARFDPEAVEKVESLHSEHVVVVIIDHGVAEVFSRGDFGLHSV